MRDGAVIPLSETFVLALLMEMLFDWSLPKSFPFHEVFQGKVTFLFDLDRPFPGLSRF